MAEQTDESWRSRSFRSTVRNKFEKAIRKYCNLNPNSAVEMEIRAYQKARSKTEYVGYAAMLLKRVQDMWYKNAPDHVPGSPYTWKEEDWRYGCNTVCNKFAQARKNALFVDVHFLVGREGSARNFSAHKMILACGSPVFEAMFFGPLAEKNDPIHIPDDDLDGFETMLRYLYGEQFSFPSIIEAFKAYSIADKYLIPELQRMSANFISLTTMDDADFFGIVNANLLSCTIAEEKFKKYIRVHASRLLKSEEFMEMPEDIVIMILQMDEIDITEFELLVFATKWGLKKFTKDTTWKLQGLLQIIRFSTLTSREFCRFHDSFPDVLDPATCVEILKHLNDPDTYKPPYWCSTNTTIRNKKANLRYRS